MFYILALEHTIPLDELAELLADRMFQEIFRADYERRGTVQIRD